MGWLLEVSNGFLHSVVHRPYAFLLFALYALITTWHLGLFRWAAMSVARAAPPTTADRNPLREVS